MTRHLLLPSGSAGTRQPDGTLWVVMPGDRACLNPHKPAHAAPPADLLAAAAPCETCGGRRTVLLERDNGGIPGPCPDCRIELSGGCPMCGPRCSGIVTLGHAYAVGGVLPIVGDGHALAGDYIEVVDGGEVYQRHMDDDDEITSTTLLADDPAWEALVGQYALKLAVIT